MSAASPDTKINPEKGKEGLTASPTPAASAQQPKPGASATAANGTGNTKRKGTTKRFLSAYAQTWIGMTPIWLMGEAILPGAKVGGTFKKGTKKLFNVAEELREALMTSSEDVVVILDKHFKLSSKGNGDEAKSGAGSKDKPKSSDFDEQSRRAAEVIRAAGESAIVAVSTSLTNAQSQVHGSSPQIKKLITKHGKDVVILVDKALKNPIVITGVSRFARSKGIPYSEGLLRLASMGLARILAAIPEEVEEQVESEIRKDAAEKQKHEVPGKRWEVEELDADELERTSTPDARNEAASAGKLGGDPKVEGDKLKQKQDGCVIC
jgi:hypothetical protein